ncbi:DUF397 domain-containing protein [Streptomyces morookaense]|uniref:DUF397 domain-containing protein n=1 Tax=Streptomyces morookaense TaxID=1970 RepID=UPI0033F540E7
MRLRWHRHRIGVTHLDAKATTCAPKCWIWRPPPPSAIPREAWFKSSYSGAGTTECVEVAQVDVCTAVRASGSNCARPAALLTEPCSDGAPGPPSRARHRDPFADRLVPTAETLKTGTSQ